MGIGNVKDLAAVVTPEVGAGLPARVARMAASVRSILEVLELALEKLEDVCDAIAGRGKDGFGNDKPA